MPKITVIVPVYDVEKYLDRCVDSILNQTFTDFELILVDDGSPDNCGKICDEYAKKDNRITVIHKENGGLSDARNVALDMIFNKSDSEWLTFIDSDDWVHPNCLEIFYNFAVKADLPIIMAEVFVTNGEVEFPQFKEEYLSVERVNDAFRNVKLDPPSVCGRLYKKELFKDVRFPFGKLFEDRFTSYKLLFRFEKVGVVNFPLYYYFMNDDGITHAKWSPRMLDNLEAAENQLAFFKATGNSEMYDYITDDYINHCIYNLKQIGNGEDKAKYRNIVRQKLRKTLKKEKRKRGFSVKKNFNYYKYAYPFIMKVYRRLFMRKSV